MLKRARPIHIRVTDSEYTQIAEAAERAHVSVSGFVRQVVFRAIEEMKIDPKEGKNEGK